jgi:hypothetical protein
MGFMIARRLTLVTLVLLCAAAGALALASATASAFNTHVFSSSFGGPGSGAGQVSSPAGVAINSVTHDVYVADPGNFRIDEFSSSGTFLRAWGWGVADGLPAFESCTLSCQAGLSGSGAGQFTSPVFVAVDNSGGVSAGDVYVGDTGDNLVSKFDASGNLVSGWGSGGQLNGSTTSAGSFGRLAGVAVDGSGKLTVINENESKLVFEFVQDGTFDTQFEVARGTAPNGLAVDAMGDIFKVNGSENVEEITGSGSDVGQVTLSEAAKGIAVDPLTGDLYTDEGGHVEQYVFSGAGIVSEPGGSTCVVKPEAGCGASDSFGSGNLTGGTGIAVDPVSGTSGTVYVADAATNGIDVFVPAVVPDVNTGQASNVHPAGVTLNGSVDPDGLQVTACRFEYGTSGSYGQSIPCEQPPGSGTSPVAVSANLTALQPNTEYHFRLLASNANGIKYGVDVTVTTTGPPRFDGEWITNVTTTSATFNTKVNPLWPTNAEYRLEYGTSTSYGQTLTGSVGEGANDLLVSVHRQDLQPGTTYHYRFVDSNVYGTVEGPDHVFTTQATGGQEPSLLDGRAWELVSPSNKNGALIEDYGGVPIQAASDGSGISYGASEAIGENPEGKTAISQILSTRGPDGWKSQDISLPQGLAKEEELAYDGYEYQMFSPDLSLAAIWQHAVAASPLAPEAADGKLYLRDDTDGSFLPLFTTANIPPGTNLHEEVAEGRETKVEFATATPDLSHVILASRLVLTSEAIEGSRQSPDGTIPQQMNLYEWSAGRFQPVNVLPGEITTEKTVPGANIGGSTKYGNIPRAVSGDGRWVVWTLGEPYSGGPSSLYVRNMVEKRTVQIGGDDARVLAMSSDGSKIFFLEGSAGSGNSNLFQGGELYEFDTATGVQTALTSDHGPGESSAGVKEGLLGTSEDGSWVYFMANGVLGDGAERGATTGNCVTISHSNGEGSCNLYVWHDGTTKYIARLSSEDAFDWYYESFGGAQQLGPVRSRVSPDGRYLTFMSNGSLTGYDNLDANSGEPDEEVYMYDAVTDHLVCASCDPTGARPVGIPDTSNSTNILMEYRHGSGSLEGHWLAGITPSSQENLFSHEFHQPRYLSDTGRLFFDSPDALVPQDTNGLMDVYEYEPAGVGSCTAVSITFSERSGGCVSLVSSGTSSQESAFYDASENGDDAFFLTASRLSAADYDTSVDVYDAHVCSTAAPCVAVPVSPPPCTSGDSCKAAPSPQPDIFGPTPSATFNGAGNVVASPVGSVVKPKSLTRAQKLARALKACRREGARRRAMCERQVRKRYAVKRSRKANAKKKGGRR